MKTSFLILAVICMPLLIHTSEFVQRWVRATHKDSIELRLLLNPTSSITGHLVWENQASVWYERKLSSKDVRAVRLLVDRFSPGTKADGDFSMEALAGSFMLDCGGPAGTLLEMGVAESGWVFVSFHQWESYDSEKRCFEAPGALELVRELIRKRGAHKNKVAKIPLPPPPRQAPERNRDGMRVHQDPP